MNAAGSGDEERHTIAIPTPTMVNPPKPQQFLLISLSAALSASIFPMYLSSSSPAINFVGKIRIIIKDNIKQIFKYFVIFYLFI